MTGRVRVAGVDGARGGWAAVVLAGGRFEWALLVPALAALDGVAGRLGAVGVDMPIALAPDGDSWPRPADEEARRFLGPRWASVFRAPPEPVLACSTYAEANRRHRELTGSGISGSPMVSVMTVMPASPL